MSDLFTLISQLAADAHLEAHQRQRRDRRIGRELTHLGSDPTAQLRAWLARVASSDTLQRGAAAERGQRLIGFAVFMLGLLVGWVTALAVFHYDGSRPVNITHVLAVFVVLQLLLLAVFLITCLPAAAWQALPGVSALRDTLSVFNPGRWGMWLSHYLPTLQRESLDSLLTVDDGRGRALGPLRRWSLARWSQGFAVAFNAAALAGALYLVTVSDLAFGWSTTLDIDAETFHGMVHGLALPWRSWLPDGVPSPELVDTTRYFRIDSGLLPQAASGTDPALMGTWWPFLVMCLLTYGLAPRLLTWGYSAARSRRAATYALSRLPGAAELLERLNMPVIETAATRPEARADRPVAAEPGNVAHPVNGRYLVVDWANTLGAATGGSTWSGVAPEAIHAAGGARSLDADAKLATQLGRQGGNATIAVFVKAWEPPLLDFMDFVTALRHAVGEQRRIAVTPIAQDTAGRVLTGRPQDLDTWRAQVSKLADPATFVQRVPGHD